MNRIALALLLTTLPVAAEPGVTLLLDSRQGSQRQLSAQTKRYLYLLRQANQLEEFQLHIASADWSDPAVAALWQRQFAVTSQELPALAVVNRQGNRFTVENLLRHYQAPRLVAQDAFKCLQVSAPNLIRQIELHTGVALTSKPPGARLEVDGKEAGVTPCQLPLTPGNHRLQLILANHEPYLKQVHLEEGQTYAQDVVLVPQTAFLRVESGTVPVQISVDGGEPTATPLLVDLSAGNHHYVATAPGHYTAEGDLLITPERLTSVHITLVPVRLRVVLGRFEAQGYTGVNTHSSGTGWRRTEWQEPYEVFLDPAALQDKMRQGLTRPDYDLVEADPDCVLSVEIRSSKEQVVGTATLADSQGKVRQTLSAERDMPFMTFDEQGSARRRADEVLDDLLGQLGPALGQFQPQTDRTPAGREAQVKVEVGPTPAP